MQFTENKCPITLKSILELKNPVITPSNGVTYEREAIEKWIRENGNDPITREPLQISQLIVNRALMKDEINIPKTQQSKKDITVVMDISGSMNTEATYQNDEGNTERSGLSYHDIVCHSVKVIINSLSEEYRLSLVTFSSNAKLAMPLTWMNDNGKKNALNIIKNINVGGTTDLWGGLFTGLQNNKHGEIYLLTDGLPSYAPPRGWSTQLEKYKESNPNNSSVVKTFGFGYSLDSKLLHDISHHFAGNFSYIPDAGFVGTAFIHALTNTLVPNHMKDDPKIDCFLEFANKLIVLDNIPFNDLSEHLKLIKEYKEKYPNGIFEEQIDIACSCKKYYNKWGKHYIRSLYDAHFYQECNNFKDPSVQNYATEEQKKIIDKLEIDFGKIPPPEPSIKHYNHYRGGNNSPNYRGGNNSPNYRGGNNSPTNSQPVPLSMRCFSQPTGGCFSGNCRIETNDGHKLIRNLTKGDLLKTENGYNRLICVMKTISSNGTNKLVELDSKLKFDDLKHNSIYDDIPSLECVDCEKTYSLGGIESYIKPGEELCECSKLLVTEWHPIKHQNDWTFPINIHKSKVHNIPFVYSFVVENSHTVYIEGWECITLGHGIENNPVASHSFWGTDKVIDCLKSKPGWEKGEVEIFSCVRSIENEVIFLN